MYTVAALDGEELAQVVAGTKFTLALTRSGEVWSWGEGGAGNALGHGGSEAQVRPTKVAALKGHVVTSVAAGAAHAAAVTADGALYTFGCGVYGRLGHGDTQDQASPRTEELREGKERK